MKAFLLFALLVLTQSVSAEYFRNVEEFDTTAPYAYRTNEFNSNDSELIARVIASYQLAKKEHLGNSMWQLFFDQRHAAIHDIFMRGDFNQCAHILRHPKDSDLFYGFDNLCASILTTHLNPPMLMKVAHGCLDLLVRFGEAIAAIRLYNPEGHDAVSSKRKWHAAEVLSQLENKLGTQIFFPNPYEDEIGVHTPHGVASHRAIAALYQAYLIKEHLKGIENPRVLEIGAGLGRTAYYARLFGIKDYTIVDIPMSNVSQAYFLGTVLGSDQVALLGEECQPDQVKILTPDYFLNAIEQRYDLVINVDSLTEMDPINIQSYIDKISLSTPLFISINHEKNLHTVGDFAKRCDRMESCDRKLHWMRTGYAEEIYRFRN